jgi:hypothetical protein
VLTANLGERTHPATGGDGNLWTGFTLPSSSVRWALAIEGLTAASWATVAKSATLRVASSMPPAMQDRQCVERDPHTATFGDMLMTPDLRDRIHSDPYSAYDAG